MGALDKVKDSDDATSDAPRESRWFGGSSRDLFGPASSHPKENSLDPLHHGSQGSPMETESAGHDIRFDGRDRALDSFSLDPQSSHDAKVVGEAIAQNVPVQEWAGASVADRVRLCDSAYRDISSGMAIEAPPPMLEFALPDETLGFTRGRDVHYNARQLDEPSPQSVIETLAHEYRHVWQQDVLSGDRQHPLGKDGTSWLAEGQQRYDQDSDDFDDYAWNPMELDAEAFARQVSRAYNDYQEDSNER